MRIFREIFLYRPHYPSFHRDEFLNQTILALFSFLIFFSLSIFSTFVRCHSAVLVLFCVLLSIHGNFFSILFICLLLQSRHYFLRTGYSASNKLIVSIFYGFFSAILLPCESQTFWSSWNRKFETHTGVCLVENAIGMNFNMKFIQWVEFNEPENRSTAKGKYRFNCLMHSN